MSHRPDLSSPPSPEQMSAPTPKPSGSPTQSGGFDANRPTIISLLYLGSIITGFSGLIGIVLAHVWSGEDNPDWMASHYTFLIRTFWIGFAASVLLAITIIGLIVVWVPFIWVAVRSIVSLVNAQKQQPMPDPKSWLI